MKNLIHYKPGEQSWVRWIKKRIKNNLNFLALAEGPTGIGKSWALIKIAYMIDPTFERRQIAFNFKEVMDIINSDWFNQKEWKIIIFDEAQVSISNRKWQSLTNRLMNYLLSTFRHRNIILLFSSPFADFLDIQTLKLLHCIFEIRSHSNKTNLTTIRPKLLQYNGRLKKFFVHSLFVFKDGVTEKQVFWKIGKPPEHLIVPYERDKMAFTDKLNQDISSELNKLEEAKSPKKELNPNSMQPDLWEIAKKGYKTQYDIQKKLSKKYGRDVKLPQISKNLTSMQKKGWDIRQFKKKTR